MKGFLKLVTANIIAMLIVGFLFVGFFVFMIVLSSFSSDTTVKIKDNSVIALKLDAPIFESGNETEVSLLDFKQTSSIKLQDIIQAIQAAAKDDKIKGISIEADNVNAGITQIDDLRAALADFKKSGKFVYAYGNTVSQSAYFLGSVADQYYLHPAGGVELKGLASEVLYMKDFFDKYGIGVDVMRHGKYKSAVEPYMTNEMSEENHEQIDFMLHDIWSNISGKLMQSRKLDSLQFKIAVDSLYGIIPETALKAKLVDKLIQKSEYDDLLKKKLKEDPDDDLNSVSMSKYISSLKDSGKLGKERIAILYAAGEIVSGKGSTGIQSQTMIEEIQEIADNDKIKAVVLRVNSPGGSANASDEILFELQKLKAKKPLIVSFGDYAASGGYYISMAGDRIFSEPNTLTGSIGVFGVAFNAKDLTARNGLKTQVVKTNDNSNMFSLFNGISDGTKATMQKSIELTYKRFVGFVMKNRKMSFDQVDEIGGGHVWSGTRAKQLGLVDELGTLDDAVKYAAKQAKLKDYSLQSFPAEKSPLERILESMNDDSVSEKILERKFGKENYEVVKKLLETDRKGIQMSTPYRISLQ